MIHIYLSGEPVIDNALNVNTPVQLHLGLQSNLQFCQLD